MSVLARSTRFLPVVILLALAGQAGAQILEVPLSGWEAVQRRATLDHRSGGTPVSILRGSDGSAECVQAGQTKTFCVDTSGIGPGATISIVDCGPLQYGTLVLDSTCLIYTANASVTYGEETLCIEVCDQDNNCTTTTFPVRVHRASVTATAPELSVPTSGDQLICYTRDPALGYATYGLDGPSARPTGTVITLDSCYRYEAGRFATTDTVTYLANYPFCVTDTFLQPFRFTGDTLDLPFFDDFSYSGPYPDPEKWLDDRAWVNDRMAWQPVSVGVATLDGVDERGRPYDVNATDRDILTSAYLDLSGYSVSDNLQMSFWAQPKGLGFRPEVKDSLVLEFKTKDGAWKVAESIIGYSPFIPTDSLAPFVYRAYGLAEPEYLYKGFQFRFRNRSDLTGALDVWHIDYVRVGKDFGKSTEDIAFTHLPSDLLNTYTAMPWSHFLQGPMDWLSSDLPIGLYNHFPVTESANPSSLTIRDLVSGQILVSGLTLLELPPVVPVNQRDLDPGRHEFLNTLNAPNLANDLQAFPPATEGVDLELTYAFDQDQETNNDDEVALRNNTVRERTHLTNYYAYDDGSAESAIVATKTGTQVAVKFTSTKADTLRAVQFHFPRYNVDATTQYFNLRIWTEALSGTPDYQEAFVKPFYPDLVFADSFQAFTTYVLMDDDGNPVGFPVPAGDFYVGWQQGSNVDDPIPVGFDKNHPEGADHAWFNTTGSWVKFPASLRGALMIRPVFGDQTPTHTPDLADVDDLPSASLRISPNPTTGWLSLGSEDARPDWQVRITDLLGRPVMTTAWSPGIDLGHAPSGWYVLNLTDGDGRNLARERVLLVR